MKLINFKDLNIGQKFLAHGEEVTLKSYRYDREIVGYVPDQHDNSGRYIYSNETVVEYVRNSGEVVVLVSQHPHPDKLDLTEYGQI